MRCLRSSLPGDKEAGGYTHCRVTAGAGTAVTFASVLAEYVVSIAALGKHSCGL